MKQATRSPSTLVVARAAGRNDRSRQPARKSDQVSKRRLPQSGYFAEADPNREVQTALSFIETADISKRPGRYQSDFIWNTDWQSQLDREAAEAAKRLQTANTAAPPQSGGLGLSRMQDLNRMDLDLSDQLRRRPAAAAASSLPVGSARQSSGQVKPTQADSRRWQRSGRFGTRAVAAPIENDAVLLAEAEKEKAEYEQLKLDLQFWTLAVSIFGFSATWLLYSKDVGVSYGVGAVGSYIYLRMLNRSIDSVAGGGLGGAISQPRLLIPLILALGYNRWNHLKAEETGVVLQLLPMLLGFFTYKAAVFGKQAATLLGELAASASAQKSTQSN